MYYTGYIIYYSIKAKNTGGETSKGKTGVTNVDVSLGTDNVSFYTVLISLISETT